MGRLKTWQNFSPLFSGKYKKLLEEFGSKDYSKLLLQETLQDYISYNCNNCGHIQRLQAEELNSIVGHAFRLAYIAHLQKSGITAGDAKTSYSSSPPAASSPFTYKQSSSISKTSKAQSSAPFTSSSNSKTKSHSSSSSKTFTPVCCNSQLISSTISTHSCPHLTPSHHHEHPLHNCCISSHHHSLPAVVDNLHTHSDNAPCKSFCSPELHHSEERKDTAVFNCCSACCNVTAETVSSRTSKASSLEGFTMRTPTPGGHVTHHSGGTVSSRNVSCNVSCNSAVPPTSLPGLRFSDHENNILQSPLSDTSNSPTDLNTTKRLGEKPPLIKNVNLCLEANLRLEDELNAVLSRPMSTSGVHVFTMCGEGRTVGYANEKSSSTDFHQSENNFSVVEEKCHLEENHIPKRISQLSNMMSSNITLDICSSSNISGTPPPIPERSDSLLPPEEPHLKTAAWFQAGIPREIALEVLSREPVGAFMVRESTSKPGCYALSLRVPRDFTASGIAHYLIVKTSKGYRIKGFTKEFYTLTALITHHSVMPELLPCPLSLSRYNPTYTTDEDHSSNSSTDEDDPDYNTLSDFRKMMADLDV